MKHIRIISLFVFTIFTFQCGSTDKSDKASKCDTPLPEAIFNSSVGQIESHTFFLDGRNATEKIQFIDKSTLTIFQSGCDKIAQEFRFQVPQQKEIDMPSLGMERLMFLANLDDKYMSFANWAQAIDGLRSEFARQNDVEVEQGFFVGLDKIDSNERTTMIIKLFQK